MKGNVVDMAVGVVIGGAFGKIVASFVGDVIMRCSARSSRRHFQRTRVHPGHRPAGAPVLLKYGAFLQRRSTS